MKKKFFNNVLTHVSLILVSIMNFFNIKVRVDSKPVRRAMYSYFNCKEWRYWELITKVDVYETKDKLFVNIETHRPGFLIGKAGRFIDGLKEYLKEELKKDIHIHLIECQLWHKLY